MNLLNETGDNLLSAYDDGYERGIDHAIKMILIYRSENVHSMTFKEYHRIREIIEYIKENV